MATAAKAGSGVVDPIDIKQAKAMMDRGGEFYPYGVPMLLACESLVKAGWALKVRDGVYKQDLRRAKAATKMGSSSTTSRSRQVAARPNRQPDTTTYSGRIARRMRKLRKAKKMSIDEMRIALESAGVVMVNSALYAYENGNRQINPDHYPALAKVLGCESVRDFLPSR